MEKEHTLWDWFSEGLGSSVLCEKKNVHSKDGRKTSVKKDHSTKTFPEKN